MKRIIFAYSILIIIFTLFSYFFIDANLPYLHFLYSGFYTNKRILTTIIYIGFISTFYLFYLLFIWLFKKKLLSLKLVKVLIGINVGFFLFSYPAMISYDIFNYIGTAKVLFFFHENPYIVMPIEFINDPILLFMHAANKIALYGPFWIILTAIPFLISFGNFLLILFNFKLIIVCFYILTILLLWKISKNPLTVIAFSLNPLVIIETLVSAHNDITMMFLSLFAFFLLSRRKTLLAIIFLTLSILIKYATLFLIPIFLYALLCNLKKIKINWQKIYYFSAVLMLLIFFLSPIREEMYPWYAIWFLTFIFLIPEHKFLFCFAIVFSFSLMLRYIPFMFSGTYFDQTPMIKRVVTFIPTILFIILYLLIPKINLIFKKIKEL